MAQEFFRTGRGLALTESLAEFLNEIEADATTLQSGARYVAAELSHDLPTAALRSELAAAAGDDAVQDALDRLASDSALLLQANASALAVLWDDPETRMVVRGALIEAKSKLPVVEITVIVLGALYALHMALTKGKKSEVKSVEVNADGSWKESTRVTFSDPSGPLSVIGGVLGPLKT